MSLKVTQAHTFTSGTNSHLTMMVNTGTTSSQMTSQSQMSGLHQSKRLKNESFFTKDSPNSGIQASDNIFIPSDYQKLQKIFPYIDHIQLEEVLKECDLDLNKAYVKIHSQDNQLHSGQIVSDADSSTSSMSISSNTFAKKNIGNLLSGGSHSTSNSCFSAKPRESKKRGRDQLDLNFSQHSNFTRQQLSSAASSIASAPIQQQNQEQQMYVGVTNQTHNNQMVAAGSSSYVNQPTAAVQAQQTLEEMFAESAVNSLMNIPSTDQAAMMLQSMLATYKEKIQSELLAKQNALIMGLVRDNSILKKGVRIQNKRIEDCNSKLQDYEQLVNFSQQQHIEIAKLREENQKLKLSMDIQRKSHPINTTSRHNFNHHQDHLDDPMV